MAGKHSSTGFVPTTGAIGVTHAYDPRLDKAFAEGREAGIKSELTGADDTSTAAATMTDSGAGLTIDAEIGKLITNVTNSTATQHVSAVITDNSGTVVTGVLVPASNWDSGDTWHITGALASANPHVATTPEGIAWLNGLYSAWSATKQFETDRA